MDVSNISLSTSLSTSMREEVEANTLVDAVNKETESSLYVTRHIGKRENFPSASYGLYIVGEHPLSLVEKLKHMPDPPGIPVFTLVGESGKLHGSTLGKRLTHFLLEQGYIDASQSGTFNMVFNKALSNAIEYGNLELGDFKASLVNNPKWQSVWDKKVSDTLSQEDNQTLPVMVQCYLNDDTFYTAIENVGPGFNAEGEMKSHALSAHETPHGTGMKMMYSNTDHLVYENEGRRLIFGINAHFLTNQQQHEIKDLSLSHIHREGIILIVDDQRSNRELAKFYLESAGYNPKNIVEAEDGEGAIEAAHKHIPDIILLDIVIPNMDGFAVCRHLKQDKKTAHIPVLFLSGLTDVKSRVKGYRLGAVDYVNKPIDRSELVARTDIHIQQGLMLKSLKNYSSRIQQDLARARTVQESLLPSKKELTTISRRHNVKIEYEFSACDELAGDYLTVFDIDKKNVGLAMVDFTGHGVVASLNTIRIHALLHELEAYLTDPAKLAAHINTRLNKLLSIGDFATFIYGVLNTQTGHFKYAGCGAPPIALIPHNNNAKIKLMDASGVPLGLVPTDGLDIAVREETLKPNDTLLLYSDALIETKHKNGERWEDQGLTDALALCKKRTAESFIKGLGTLFKKSATFPLEDDLSLLSITFGGKKS